MMQTNATLSLAGIYPPVPTPFKPDGDISVGDLELNLKLLNGYDLRGIVVLGSNGEYVMLRTEEKIRLMTTVRAAVAPDRLVIAGTGCQATSETIELSIAAAEIGADAVLVITPSYYRNLMTPDTLIKHFRAVADASPVPVLLYNMPACTGIDMNAHTIAEMAQHPNIIGLKDSSGNIAKMAEIRALTGDGFQILAGSGGYLLPALSVGAVGGVMALANIAPAQCSELYKYVLKGDMEKAREIQARLAGLNTAVTSGGGVPALKAAMDMLGMYGGPVRPPLQPLPDTERNRLAELLKVL